MMSSASPFCKGFPSFVLGAPKQNGTQSSYQEAGGPKSREVAAAFTSTDLALAGEAEEVGHGLADDSGRGDGPFHRERLSGARLAVRHHAHVEAICSALHQGLDLGVYVLLGGLEA